MAALIDQLYYTWPSLLHHLRIVSSLRIPGSLPQAPRLNRELLSLLFRRAAPVPYYFRSTIMHLFALFLALFPLKAADASRSNFLTPEDYRVKGLELIEPAYAEFQGEMFAGMVPMDNGDRHGEYMFWFFAPDNATVPDSLTFFLNGGPGCSSFNGGVFFEHGPVTVTPHPAGFCCADAHDPLQYNEFSWAKASNMLYVEQPVGVGFSHGGPAPVNETEVAQDFFAFLQNWMKIFKKYQKHTVWVTGESYAGYYVPSIAHTIHKNMQNYKALDSNDKDDDGSDEDRMIYIRLGGMALGNAWVDARVQGPATIDYAYWHGLIDQYTQENLHAIADRCLAHPQGSEPKPFHAFTTPDDCAIMEGVLEAAGKGVLRNLINGPNLYDVTTWDNYDVIQDGDTTINDFMNLPGVKQALNAPLDVEWAGCIPGAGRRRHLVSTLLDHDQPISTLPYIAELLDAGKRVLVYNGDRDLSTCVQGSEALLNSMIWGSADRWPNATRGLWVVDNKSAGYAKSLSGLDFVVIYNSGHLVPFNQPRNALDLITRFLKGESFLDYQLPSFDYGRNASLPTSSEKARYVNERQRTILHPRGPDSQSSQGYSLFTLFITSMMSLLVGVLTTSGWRLISLRSGYQPIAESREGGK